MLSRLFAGEGFSFKKDRAHQLTLPHMWNGPRGKSFFSRFHTLARCGHMSGLCARHMAAGLDEIRGTRS